MRFANEMAFYSAYHQERRNIMIHIFGVPAIFFSLLIVTSWVNLYTIGEFTITLSMVFTAIVLGYYFSLDLKFALASTVILGILLYTANWLSLNLESNVVWGIFAIAQISGWGTQFYGHFVYEKSRPALFDNLFQAVVSAPLFVIADVCFALGIRKELEEQVKTVLKERGKYKDFSKQVAA
ncbi:Mpo1 family 2-hydroxy fatty acid dioxygenase [Leptospira sp. GIMC2001]|uniref:Mpo1 family 2-hydroxy fatty acid dioxygenase n=1 Tax=Leptospira sp. GIMC2001 TaxID=1513297 RepID=UPI002349CBDF|nr:Mpo1-like protein [Leptospira sp. GIMC2001]WCL50150.1 DUF962 domain-containing protein [Leptospira sp. GIMC2001]